jgi:hypothetical protein
MFAGRGAFVKFINSAGQERIALTNPFGYYHFASIPVGETYIVSVAAKRYTLRRSLRAIFGISRRGAKLAKQEKTILRPPAPLRENGLLFFREPL